MRDNDYMGNGGGYEWLLFNTKCAILSYIMTKTSAILWDDDDIRFVLDQHS